MEIMVVNGQRYLINTSVSDHVVDKACADILKYFPDDADVYFDEVKKSDVI